MAGCGKSKLTSDFLDAASMQENLDQISFPTWLRSPTIDSGNPNLTAADSYCASVPKTNLLLRNIQGVKSPLRSDDLIVYRNMLDKSVKSFWDYLLSKDDCFSDDFQVPHSFGHTRFALDFMTNIFTGREGFPGIGISSKTAPVTVYASEEAAELRNRWESAFNKKDAGNSAEYNSLIQKLGSAEDAAASVFSTHYDTFLKSMRFYKDSEGALPNFNAGQEADAIYHEACHHFQNVVQPTYMRTSVSDASGALAEGLADFCAAAIVRDDNILSYFKSNAPTIFGASNWNGPKHQRSLRHSLRFPANYVGEIHLDGRVVAGALNDFRRYLAGETIQILGGICGGSCSRKMTSRSALSTEQAWDAVLRLSYMALYYSSASDSLARYSGILKDELQNACSTRYQSFCNTETRGVLLEILNGRGLAPVAVGNAFHVAASDILVDSNLAFVRYPVAGRSGFNDAATVARDLSASVAVKDVGRCEVLMVYPVIRNNSHLGSRPFSIVNGTIKYAGVSIQSSSVTTAQVSNYFLDPSNKLVPWLSPAESSGTLISTGPRAPVVSGGSVSFSNQSPSRLYADSFGSVFTQPFSADFNQSPVGWTIVAPPNVGDRMTITFKLSLTPFESGAAFDKTDVLPSTTTTYSTTITVNSAKSYPCL